MVGAASKGIIQRDHQHNAVVYKTYYQPNPFGNMTEDDLNKYKQEVEAKQKGGDGEWMMKWAAWQIWWNLPAKVKSEKMVHWGLKNYQIA